MGEEGFIFVDGNRILIPKKARPDVLEFLHQGHCGYQKTKQLAHELYFWPGMNNDIKSFVSACQACNKLKASLPKESVTFTKATYPLEFVGIDLFQAAGRHYMVLVDCYSGYPMVAKLNQLHTSAITDILSDWFAEFGYPKIIRTDGGPQFRDEFNRFCEAHGIKKETSSPYFPQSNGLAEAAVKQAKRLLKKVEYKFKAFKKAFLHWRNTPRVDSKSPAQLFFGFRQNFGQAEQKPPVFIDRTSASLPKRASNDLRNLPTLQINDRVFIQNVKTKVWDTKGTIESVRRGGRSYTIMCDDGFKMIRNRRYIRRI